MEISYVFLTPKNILDSMSEILKKSKKIIRWLYNHFKIMIYDQNYLNSDWISDIPRLDIQEKYQITIL